MGCGRDRRAEGAWIARQGADELRGADLAGVDGGATLGKGLVPAPVEPDLERHAGRMGRGNRPVRIFKGQGHRLLAEDRLAGFGSLHQHICMEPRGGGDNHRIEPRMGKEF